MASDREPWSIGLGRWWGIDFRLHVSFVMVLLFLALVAWREAMDAETPLAGFVLLFTLVWLLSVLAHELGHIIVDHPIAVSADTIALTPVGGIRHQQFHRTFSDEVVPILAGPMVSATIALICFALVRSRQDVAMFSLMHPESLRSLLATGDGETSWFLAACKIAVCVNGWIVICNLVPAFPFDAGRGCGTLLREFYPQWDAQRLTLWMCVISRGTALVLLLFAVILHQTPGPTVFPFWLVLLGLSMSVYFATRGEEARLASHDEDEDALGYDFSQGYTSLEREQVSRGPHRRSLHHWLRYLRRRWQQRQARREAEEDLRVDSILERLHTEGLHSLHPSERALLRRASARYRNRLSK